MEMETYQQMEKYQPNKEADTASLEVLLFNAETNIDGNTEPKRYWLGDCPCPCPPIVSEVVYVSFSPIF